MCERDSDPGDLAEAFDSIWVEALRFGLRPRFERSPSRALAQSDVLVYPNPAVMMDRDIVRGIRDWVHEGGALWPLARGDVESESTTRTPATRVGVELDRDFARWRPAAGAEIALVSVLSTDEDETSSDSVSMVFRVGNGLLCVTRNSVAFSRKVMLHPFLAPEARTDSLYTACDAILEAFAEHAYRGRSRFRE